MKSITATKIIGLYTILFGAFGLVLCLFNIDVISLIINFILIGLGIAITENATDYENKAKKFIIILFILNIFFAIGTLLVFTGLLMIPSYLFARFSINEDVVLLFILLSEVFYLFPIVFTIIYFSSLSKENSFQEPNLSMADKFSSYFDIENK